MTTQKIFTYTGAVQSWLIPIGVTSVIIEGWGAGANSDATPGATSNWISGGYARGTLAVVPGTQLNVYCGGRGLPCAKTNVVIPGGFNGGGSGGRGNSAAPGYFGGGSGGGATDVRISGTALANRYLVAGGAGGGHGALADWGGGGGGASGGAGHSAAGYAAGLSGGGGTAAAGGAAGSPGGGAGTSGVGGNGVSGVAAFPGYTGSVPYSGSGGGGGYFGGGGGGGPAVSGSDPTPGAGGGGSGFLHASFTATTLTAGGGPVTTPAATDGVVAISYISPPAAPNPATPGTGSNQDATAIIALSWTNPATPEAGDTITAFDVQYRVVGTPNWTAVTRQVTANTFYNLPANTFVPGAAVEWQVRSVGSMSGNAGPWSQSFFFNPIAPPDAPNVTLPVAAQAVTVSPINSRWDIVTGQQQFQVRRTSATVPGTIYWDSGPIVSNVNYYNGIPFTAAVRTEHVQVRVMVNGLWSGWSDTSVNVNIAPPNAPTLNAVADNSTASILVTITNPGGGGNPAAVYNDLYRSSPYDSEIRIATLLAVNGAFLDYTPGHNVPYTYRAVAIAANGAGASS